ncbi:hypothetical protein [Gloeothece verrucosa]|uniref:Uncharacterized protein n=1 Tax=Gloeothece verrucosa (strain PCC 7822) TaxID=497965 RepID=E0UK92_GLOV7|nr:hypothetical protein [Gloeothece verrucosa]ADN15854.1 conserved hypothetical protein [Gloeothece verrucosa PCC 7822]
MSTTSLTHPLDYLIVRREGATWYFKPGTRIFYNPQNVPVSLALEDRLHRFGLQPTQIMIELFRLNGGKPGYYLVNLRQKHYYYCGLTWNDIKSTFNNLGIGAKESTEK